MKRVKPGYVKSALRLLEKRNKIFKGGMLGRLTRELTAWLTYCHENGMTPRQASIFCEEMIRGEKK